MTRDDIEKLLGGYAAGTLTPEERDALFEAALDDQQLFESLAAEEPLREMLHDPAAKAQLLAALDERPAPWYRRLAWPAFGVAAGAAMVLMAVLGQHERPKPEPVIVAETRREPVRSFQPPLPVEKSPVGTVLQSKPVVLPPPPALPAAAPAPPPASLDAIAPAAPPAPAAPTAQKTEEALSAVHADSESAKEATLRGAAAPAFRALSFVAAPGNSAAAARLGLRYTVLKKSPAGDLTAVDPQAELDRGDEVVLRFEATDPGFLSVSQIDVPDGLRTIANSNLLPGVPYSVPITGSARAPGASANEFQVRFSRQPQNALKRQAAASGQAGAVGGFSTGSEPSSATFNITLKYK
ncbi:MAG TPA: hypothetical protein VG096_19290 [Bryobacteraceae bacterium]|jgi:hypothetical protein|nr:hypothetical protein [Bryobacteraceae bacterium]